MERGEIAKVGVPWGVRQIMEVDGEWAVTVVGGRLPLEEKRERDRVGEIRNRQIN